MRRIEWIGAAAVLLAASALADDNYTFHVTDRLKGANEAEVTQIALRAFADGDDGLLREVMVDPALAGFASADAMRRVRRRLPAVIGPLRMTSQLLRHGPAEHVATDPPGTLHRFFEVTVSGFDLAAPERRAVARVESGTDWRPGAAKNARIAFRIYRIYDFSLEPPVADTSASRASSATVSTDSKAPARAGQSR